MDIKTKQPFEVLDYDVDCAKYIPEGDAIKSAHAVIIAAPDDSLYIDKVVPNGAVIKVWLGAGTDGSKYKITGYGISLDGRAIEFDFMMHVRDE